MEAPRHCKALYKGYSKIPTRKSASTSQEKNLLWRVMKTVSLKIKESIFRRKKGNLRKLEEPYLLSNEFVEKGQLIADQGLQIDESLSLYQQNSSRLRIYVKIASKNKTVVVGAKDYHIVHEIKAKIFVVEGIKSDLYDLVYDGNKIEEYRTLASLNIKTEATLHLIFRPRDDFLIIVKTPRGKVLELGVYILYTVRDVKTIVESKIGCPVGDCKMIYGHNELQDSRTLAFYGIEENSILELQPTWFQIFVKMWNGKTITLYVNQSNTIQDVKEKLFCKMGMPIRHQYIMFSGKRLQENCFLESYSINKHSTLHQMLRI
ncbi:hypothetical protein UlMin_010007 [Ulmus minor]